MGKIIIIDNASPDGVIQDPAGDEGFRVGGWVGEIAGRPELAKPRSTRHWAPRPCCWVGAATSGSPRGGHPGPAPWPTG